MRCWIFGAWIVWTIVGIAGCVGEPNSGGKVPWLRLDMNQRPQQTVRPPQTVDNGGQVGGESAWNAPNGRPWRYIVIHHSANERGNATTIDAAHKARGWDELGYHFVIDNGNGGPAGRVEVGSRWRSQKWGAHTGNTPNNAYNKYGIGVCLVGNFTSHLPSRGQLAAMDRLVKYLMVRYDISPQNVIGHRDAPGAKTDCPGDALHSYIHNTLRPSLSGLVARR